jgi:hypothetical protein
MDGAPRGAQCITQQATKKNVLPKSIYVHDHACGDKCFNDKLNLITLHWKIRGNLHGADISWDTVMRLASIQLEQNDPFISSKWSTRKPRLKFKSFASVTEVLSKITDHSEV